MPIHVVLQNINNEKIAVIVPPDALLNDILPFGDPAFCLLQFVDLYGDTIFNGLQMQQFIKEWDIIVGRVTTEEGRESLLRIRELALQCQRRPHIFLRFIGD